MILWDPTSIDMLRCVHSCDTHSPLLRRLKWYNRADWVEAAIHSNGNSNEFNCGQSTRWELFIRCTWPQLRYPRSLLPISPCSDFVFCALFASARKSFNIISCVRCDYIDVCRVQPISNPLESIGMQLKDGTATRCRVWCALVLQLRHR